MMIKIRSMRSIILGGFIITAAGVTAYMMKSFALEQEQQLASIEAQISEEKDKITVLEADWSYLTRPSRIQQLSREMLDFAPAEPSRILTLDILEGEANDDQTSDDNFFQIKKIRGVE